MLDNATTTTLSQDVGYSPTNTYNYIFDQKMLNINTMLPCKIIAITGSTFTIQPLNNIIRANGSPIAQPLIYNIPASITMGGTAGIIIEYIVGDVVLVGFCQRDITTIKQSWLMSNPSTFRKFNLADGIIINKLSNVAPNIYIKITADGIVLNAPSLPVTVNAATVALGTGAANKVLLEGVPLTANIAGVAGGGGVSGVAVTITAGGSSTVTASN